MSHVQNVCPLKDAECSYCSKKGHQKAVVLTRIAFLQLPVVSGFKVELDNKGSRFGLALKRSTSAVFIIELGQNMAS